MNSVNSVKKAVRIIEKHRVPYALLQCTNLYPTPPHLVRLNSMLELKKNFPKAVIGLSDHTKDNYTSYAALGLGAKIIEKHFIDKKSRNGPDVSASMDINQLKDLLEASRVINDALKYKGSKKLQKKKLLLLNLLLLLLYRLRILKNEKFTSGNIWVKRPGTGEILAGNLNQVIGKKLRSIFLVEYI